MRYKFKKLILHNFLSFGDATIQLEGKGYCLISGVNHCPIDRALSNGSGKSSIISGISYCLTGQTIQGISTDIENTFTKGGCFVSLEFSVNSDDFIITRYKNHEKFKTDLKIIKNGEDISGKGIRESEKALARELPELTPQLLSSVILLGQGLPSSFTKNTPSGRKELLEQLTGSDFMIEDVKTRINSRLAELNNSKRELEDLILSDNTKKDLYQKEISKLENKLNSYNDGEYGKNLADLQTKIENAIYSKDKNKIRISQLDEEIAKLTEQLTQNNTRLSEELNNIYSKYALLEKNSNDILIQTKSELTTKELELNKIKNIKEFCPTCGQRLIGVQKPSTSNLEQEINNLNLELINLNKSIDTTLTNKNNEISEVRTKFDSTNINTQIVNCKSERDMLIRYNEEFSWKIDNLNGEIDTLKRVMSEYQMYNTQLIQQKNYLNEVENNLLYNNKELDNLQQHLDIVNKVSTLVKRDFRGYLLLNIIEYVERKSKEYCKYIFNSDDLNIQLNGNNIDITFSGKNFASLSGGEKQKIDVIIQFAIRDMMSKYLDFNSNILFLDEITDNLDSVGCDGLINLISNTLNDLESIFIISHHKDEIQLPCDTELVVVKNIDGISKVG